jgi:glycosyltransferase involved in cell wall biosynthesis
MNILLLTPDIPYPTASGAAIRNYGIIRGLADAGHTLTLLTFVQDAVDETTNPLYDICEHVYTAQLPTRSKSERIRNLITSTQADIQYRLQSAAFEAQLIELLQHNTYDVIQFSGIELGYYVATIQQHNTSAKLIYDALNAEAELQRVIFNIDRKKPKRLPAAIYSYIQAQRIKAFERHLCNVVDCVIAVSDEDKVFLSAYNGAPIYVMSNGIFVDDYTPAADIQRNTSELVYTGKMDYRPNVDAIEWFASAILPTIRQQQADTTLTIVGRNPHPRIQPYAEQSDITITGWVDSVQPYLHHATVFIVPLRMGSGTRLKILEAMASGCAVVSTSIGAAGLHADVRQAMRIADDADAFTQSVVSLLQDEALRSRLGEQSIQQVRRYYDWSALIPKLLNAYKDIGLG